MTPTDSETQRTGFGLEGGVGWVIVVLEKTLESPLDSKEIQPVHPIGN